MGYIHTVYETILGYRRSAQQQYYAILYPTRVSPLLASRPLLESGAATKAISLSREFPVGHGGAGAEKLEQRSCPG